MFSLLKIGLNAYIPCSKIITRANPDKVSQLALAGMPALRTLSGLTLRKF
jgi:hypothetical protein